MLTPDPLPPNALPAAELGKGDSLKAFAPSLLCSSLEGVLYGFVLSGTFWVYAQDFVARAPWKSNALDHYLWLWFSLSIPLMLLRLILDRRSGTDLSWPERGSRSAEFILVASSVTFVISSGVAADDPGWALYFSFPALFVGILGISLSRRRKRSALVCGASLALCLSLWSAWPTQVALKLSRSNLEALVKRIEDGQPVNFPQRAGLFIVHRIAVRRGVTCLVTHPGSTGFGGLTPCTNEEARGAFNIWSCYALSEDWQLIFED